MPAPRPHALLQRARRRQRLGGAVLAVAVAIAGAIWARAGTPSRRGDEGFGGVTRAGRVPGYHQVAVLARPAEFLRADFRTGRVDHARPPAGTLSHYPTVLVRRLGGFAFATDGRAYSSSLHLEAPLNPLGAAVDVLPARRDDRMWLVDLTRTSAREVDLHGRSYGVPVALPVDAKPLAEVHGGWLVAPGGGLELRAADGRAHRISAHATVLDVRADAVLWRDDQGDESGDGHSVVVTQLPSGSEERLTRAPGRVVAGALGPRLAMVAVVAEPGTVTVLATAASPRAAPRLPATTISLPAPAAAAGGTSGGRRAVAVWSSDGRFVFAGIAGATVAAIAPESGKAHPTRLPFTPAIVVG